jgi:glycosyltransferase involved in cell wall biosynthesis
MTIGIDVSLLQTAHRKRGIGYTLINFLNHLPEKERKTHTFIFYVHENQDGEEDPFELFDLQSYEHQIRYIPRYEPHDTGNKGRIGLLYGALNQLDMLKDSMFGDSRIKNVSDLDYFIQFNQNQPVPSRKRVKSALVLYDIIPYVMESDYLWSYSTARLKGRSRKNSVRMALMRGMYFWKTKLVSSKPHKLLAISEHTKNDFVKYIGIKPNTIDVCLLGVDLDRTSPAKDVSFSRYNQTNWGPIPKPTDMPKKFLLYLGGGDQRRKLVDLLSAFNQLRAQGEDVSLIMAGDIMQGPDSTPIEEHREYYKSVSYMDDIYFLGFVSDEQRNWLYDNALACIYPSVYEGFGLPVLEAMAHSCPVITYDNTSIAEVAGDAALYASGSTEIVEHVKELLGSSALLKRKKKEGLAQAGKFSWKKNTQRILENLITSTN